jgi:hypothetical protein
MKLLLWFGPLLMYASTLMAEPVLLDRLIVEINAKSYSQRQIEIYQGLRTIAMGETPAKALPHADTWAGTLETFKNEMMVYSLIESDAQRLESFQADQKKLEEGEKSILRWQQSDKAFDDFVRRRGLTEAEIVRVLITVFRVQAYVRSRVQLISQGSGEDGKFLSIDPMADWFQSLQKLTSYRYYGKARDYIPLVPFRS